MFTVSEPSPSDMNYLLGGRGDGAIGFDGMGAVDWGKSEVEEILLRPIVRTFKLKEMCLIKRETPSNIIMRRAVREFDLLYEDDCNVLLVSEKFFSKHRAEIEPNLVEALPAECHFGSRSRPYIFGNLKNYFCWETAIDWSLSTFIQVDHSSFHINQTRIERGEYPFNHEVPYEARGLKFQNAQNFMETLRNLALSYFMPESMSLKLDEKYSIVNLGFGGTLFKESLTSYLREGPRPKYKVPGMRFSFPRIPVRFQGLSHAE